MFRKQFLDFRKKHLNCSLTKYLNQHQDLRKSLKIYFPYINHHDMECFEKYIRNSIILYSNSIQLSIDKEVLNEYTRSLKDDKIEVDVIRLNFTKNFIYNFGGKIKKYSTIKHIDTSNHLHFKENGIYFYNFQEISNKEHFLKNILNTNIYYKYLLHQDIHNSIINPILNSIMLSNYYKTHPKSNSVMIQLKDITQIYKFTNKTHSKIEMLYFVQEYFIYDKIKSDMPINRKIEPYLLIKIDMEIKEKNIIFNLTY